MIHLDDLFSGFDVGSFLSSNNVGEYFLGAALAGALVDLALWGRRFVEWLPGAVMEHREHCAGCQRRAAARRARHHDANSQAGRALRTPFQGSATAPAGTPIPLSGVPAGAFSPADASRSAHCAASVQVATPTTGVVATGGGRLGVQGGHPPLIEGSADAAERDTAASAVNSGRG